MTANRKLGIMDPLLGAACADWWQLVVGETGNPRCLDRRPTQRRGPLVCCQMMDPAADTTGWRMATAGGAVRRGEVLATREVPQGRA